MRSDSVKASRVDKIVKPNCTLPSGKGMGLSALASFFPVHALTRLEVLAG
jgi:hypothetical protein